jgi:quinol monooxygenase YgiN
LENVFPPPSFGFLLSEYKFSCRAGRRHDARARAARNPEVTRLKMSDDEAQGEDKKLEDMYAAEINDEDDDYDLDAKERRKKQKTEVKPAWTLIVTLTFDSEEKVEACKKLVGDYSKWIKENEPRTLSYQMMCSDSQPMQVCILERYEDKSYAYSVAHKTSPEFFKFRPALAALEPKIDGHSYFESVDGFIAR